MSARRLLLAAALGLTLVTVWWTSRLPEDADEALVVASTRARAGAPAPAASAPARNNGASPALASRFPGQGADLFPAQSWRPPPKPVVLPPPPPPQAPALPFRFVGRWQEDGADVVFLDERERTSVARQGDKLGPWRVDAIRDQVMTFTYMPLDQQRTLRLAP